MHRNLKFLIQLLNVDCILIVRLALLEIQKYECAIPLNIVQQLTTLFPITYANFKLIIPIYTRNFNCLILEIPIAYTQNFLTCFHRL